MSEPTDAEREMMRVMDECATWAPTAVRERPILFSGPMVRALLDGRKTQTRRVIVPQPRLTPEQAEVCSAAWDSGDIQVKCPYGVSGDRLWVRETWQHADWTEDGEPFVRYAAGALVRLCEGAGAGEALVDRWAELSTPENYTIDGKAADRRWRPSIFMPRWACRLTLELTDVRVERVRDISVEDIRAEGLAELPLQEGEAGAWWGAAGASYRGPRRAFEALWDSLNAKRGHGWDVNPWVWALTFRVVDGAP